ncbi:rifin [Plasmodium reichenowi]|uniref:Rifin n=1 Tax=Plasmodium reichenowi TaxID=5854 RepID=A0A060RLX0_PLARE|nr:rifin [Plasmodium reichenowi]
MKVHHINILLFALPLNILVYNQRNHKNTTNHTPKIPSKRLLCKCDIYEPANYVNHPQMKSVMDNFSKQTQQRFHEYDDRMKTTRQKCKDRCDKEIQKIILKDKLEKQMAQQLSTLETKIDTDDIPTCICKKSVADKVEKTCLRCAQNLGGIVAPSLGVLAGIAEGALYAWKPTALDAAIKAAITKGATKISAAGAEAGLKAGKALVIKFLEESGVDKLCPNLFESIRNTIPYNEVAKYSESIFSQKLQACSASASSSGNQAMCTKFEIGFGLMDPKTHNPIGLPKSTRIKGMLEEVIAGAEKGAKAAEDAAKVEAAAAITEKEAVLFEAGFNSSISSINAAIIASIVAIIIIVLVMVIIYKILRYRRKKKMKKKLQYIKLLEE